MLSLAAALAAPTIAVAAEPAGQLTKPPELVTFVEAPFPESEKGHTGSVVLAITIRDDGTVEDATVQESAGTAFDEAAVAAAKQFVFAPAEIDGKPARIGILYRYAFVEKVDVSTADFTGVVKDRDTHTPLPGVTVSLADGRSVVTDAEGRFTFVEVPAGTSSVTLEGERLTPLSTEENFVGGEKLEATYEVFLNEEGEESDDLEILVQAPTIKKEAVSTVIAAEDARKVPGTQGDVLKVVENMPGVARASLGTGALVVWGAAPGDTGVYIDGVPVPRLYHDGGLRSVVGSDFVRSVALVPGGYGAAYGRGIGGLVTVSTNDLDDDVHGGLAADLYDASGSVHGPFANRWRAGVGVRYGYVGPLLSTFYPDVEDYFPIPHYADAQARIGLVLRSNETLDLTGLFSSDATRSTAPNPDPAREASEESTLDFQRVSLRYAHDVGNGTTVAATLYTGGDQTSETQRYGSVETSVSTSVRLVGVRGSSRTRIATNLTLEGGADALVATTDVTREGSVAVPAREGDVTAFGQPPPDQISSDDYTVTEIDVAPYAEADVALLDDRLHVVPGLRIDPYARSVSKALPQVGISPTHGLFLEDFHVEPRLSIRYSPSDAVTLTGAWGKYGQQPEATDLSASFGNPTLPVTTGTHYVLGGAVKPVSTLVVELTGFYTASDDLAVRNPAEQPATGEALVATGSGRTYGGQTMLRLEEIENVEGWVSYTLAWSERQDAPGLEWRPSDYDQRHVLTAVGSYSLPHGFELGARARVASGFPRTEVVGSYYDNRRDLWQPLFGEHNGIRLPTFFQADVRAAKSFAIDESTLEISLEVQNVSNQENVEEYIYDADYSTRGTITGLPILPVLGVRWSI